MADTTGISGANAAGTTQGDGMSAFRQADFLKIMLTEITHQSPLDPQDTSKMVEQMQQLQELANSTYTKFRADITWAQQLVGQQVQVQQQALTRDELADYRNKGLNPDVGYAQVGGKVSSFRIVEQTVYVTVNGKDYPIDNLKQIVPTRDDPAYLALMAAQMLGKEVVYGTDAGVASGRVTSVAYDDDGSVLLEVGGESVRFDDVLQIGIGGG